MEPKRPFSVLDWAATPEPVKYYIEFLERSMRLLADNVGRMENRIDSLEAQTQKNSQNSSKPPSSDSPYSKPKRKKKKSKQKKGGQKGHKAHHQQMLAPGETVSVKPQRCSCGHGDFTQQPMTPFYTHQHIELPRINMDIVHWVLQKCSCPNCGKTVKATLPPAVSTGYGPRLCAFIAELSGTKAMSRADVKQLCESVLGIPIATGTIQKIIDRSAEAIKPAYEHIGQVARSAHCNYIDETSWFNENDLQWLWAMVNQQVAFYRIDPHRSKQAFEQLVADWQGVLVSDGYGLYQNWINQRQTCLAHLIRKAEGLAQRKKANLKRFGQIIGAFLRQLVHFAKAPPDPKRWNDFYCHLLFTLSLYESDKDDAGRLARQLIREIDALWTFLDHRDVDPTNNRAERALRFAVLWRKRSLGTQSEKGNRWVERILSFKETCRLQGKTTFPLMVEYLKAYFNGSSPNLAWI
jgi:transposase